MRNNIKTLIFYSLIFIVFPVLMVSYAISDSVSNSKSNSPMFGTSEQKGSPKVVSVGPGNNGEMQENMREKIQEKWQKRCDFLVKRIDQRLVKFGNNRDIHLDHYSELTDRIKNIVEQLEEKGYDVADLLADLQTLEEMISEYNTEYSNFISLLEDTEEYACGESESPFSGAVQAARDQLKKVHSLRLDIREFYKDVIREDLKDLRMQIPAVSSSEVQEEDE